MPEDVEDKASALWVDRWLALQEARAKAMPKRQASSSDGSVRKIF